MTPSTCSAAATGCPPAGRSARPTRATTPRRADRAAAAHERHGRGWAGASEDDVLVEVSEPGLRDPGERRGARPGRPDPRLGQRARPRRRAGCCFVAHRRARPRPTTSPTGWSRRAVRVGRRARRGRRRRARARDASRSTAAPSPTTSGSTVARRRRLRAGPHLVADDPARSTPDEAGLRRRDREDGRAASGWCAAQGTGMPDEDDLRDGARHPRERVRRPLQHHEETFDEFLFRLREDPGHRWDHWWIAELVDGERAASRPVPWSARSREGGGRRARRQLRGVHRRAAERPRPRRREVAARTR